MLEYTPEVAARTAHLYQKVSRVIPEMEWPVHAPLVDAIRRLKQEQDAIVLAHNYQTPEIYHCVADHVGDSLGIARQAAESSASVIVMAGVVFMAETVQLLCPGRTVLTPSPAAGCSLAASITAHDVRELRRRHPGVPIVAYVNTTVEVKAEVDICCTSSNAVEVVESLGHDRVIMIPDRFLAEWVSGQTEVEIISWDGACEVHTMFGPEELAAYRERVPGLSILAHPECPTEVQVAADHVGSTMQMLRYVKAVKPKDVMLVTECSMSDNVAAECPEVNFVRPCNLCRYMKRVNLLNILKSLTYLAPRLQIPEALSERARRPIERMLAI